MILPVRLGADGTYGYFGVHSNSSGGCVFGSKKSSARYCWPVIPASWVWTRNPSSTFSRVSFSICAVCAALLPETLARTTM